MIYATYIILCGPKLHPVLITLCQEATEELYEMPVGIPWACRDFNGIIEDLCGSDLRLAVHWFDLWEAL